MNDTSRMIQLLRRLKTEMNGAVVEAMEQRGIHYPLNYGVSIPTIQTIAGEYGTSHSLALLLFGQQVRELQLAALFIDDPARATPEQLRRWSVAFTNTEIVEQAAMRHLSKTPDASDLAREWIMHPDPLLRYAGLLTGMWLVRRNGAGNPVDNPAASSPATAVIPYHGAPNPFPATDPPPLRPALASGQDSAVRDAEDGFAALLAEVKRSVAQYPPDDITANGIVRLLVPMASLSVGMKEAVETYIAELSAGDDPMLQYIANETKAMLG